MPQVQVVPDIPLVPGYVRSCSPGKACVFGPAWTDVARTGCDTRNRVLAMQLTDVVYKPGTRDCKVLTGTLNDPYSGTTIQFDSSDPNAIQIDHVYALAAAWDAGAAQWSQDQRVAFANDTDNLLAVSGKLNTEKGSDRPGKWLPPNRAFACTFIAIYLRTAAKYNLLITQADHDTAAGTCPT
ncbi:MAG: HNH endonuclease [Mycolicibacterium sp.]|nr:HNH endonuclease [Mycolicibacterium sp.]